MEKHENIEDTAMKISNAYEDCYFDHEKRWPFDAILNRYLPMADPEGEMELYYAAVALGREHPREFQMMVKALEGTGLLAA